MEFDLIERIRRRVATRGDVVLGIGDDAALLQPPAGMQLVVAMDTLNSGVHFPAETAPADIGWKALAVNLSDLAAKGACHDLEAVANAECRDPELEDAVVKLRGSLGVDRGRSAREHDAEGLFRLHLCGSDRVRHEFGVDPGLAHTPGDQLRVLRTEIDDEDRAMPGTGLFCHD